METNEMKYCLYQHTRKTDGGIFYIGIGDNKRPYSKRSRNKHWRHIVNKHDYNVEILVDEISWERACELEKLMISFYGRQDLGIGCLVNMTDGGEGCVGFKHSKKDREQMSKDRKGVAANPIRIEKMKQTNLAKGENHHMKKPEMRLLFSKIHKGKKHLTIIGDNNPAKRPEVREKLSMGNNAASRIVVDIQTGIFYECAKEVALLYNIKSEKLRDWLRNEKRNKTSLRYV
jgi:hypothetical protein